MTIEGTRNSAPAPDRRDGPGTRRYAGATAEQRDQARRTRLLQAGLEVYGTTGYASATVDALCATANVSTRNLYDHFKGLEALLIAVYDEIVTGAQQSVAAALVERGEPGTLAATARRGLSAFVDYMLADPRRARVNFVEVVGASPAVERHRRIVLTQFATLIAQAAHDLTETGELAPRDPAMLRIQISIFIGGVQEAITDWLSTPEQARPDLGVLLDATVQLIVAAATPSAAS